MRARASPALVVFAPTKGTACCSIRVWHTLIAALMRIALGVEFDGSGYCGWERQPGAPTIQGVLETALSRVATEPVATVCAGRTDAGVHAYAQVVHFDTTVAREPHAWVHGTNTHLPAAIRVLWARRVGDSFHARYSAQSRFYQYLVLNRSVRPALLSGRAAWEYRPLDVALMQDGADYLLGEHDFSAFRAAGCQSKTPVRRVHRLEVSRRGDLVVVDVSANAFLQHMVRNIVGSLLCVGYQKHKPHWVLDVLRGLDRRRAGMTASAAGLYLVGVRYPNSFRLPSMGAARAPLL